MRNVTRILLAGDGTRMLSDTTCCCNRLMMGYSGSGVRGVVRSIKQC